MPFPRRKRRRKSTGGRWTQEERDRLWKLRNQNRKSSWEFIKVPNFPDRTAFALQKQYSDIKLKKRRARIAMERLRKGSPTARTASTLGKRPSSAEVSVDDKSRKQPKIWDSDEDTTDDAPDDETDEAAGDCQVDGTRSCMPRRVTDSSPTTPLDKSSAIGKPSLVAKLRIHQRSRDNGSAAVNQPEKPPLQSPNKMDLPQNSVSPNGDHQAKPLQGLRQTPNNFDPCQRDRELSHIMESNGDPSLKIKTIMILKQAVAVMENEPRKDQYTTEVVHEARRLQAELSAQQQETSRLTALLNGKEQVETKQKAEIDRLQLEVQHQATKIGQLELELKEKTKDVEDCRDDMAKGQPCGECLLKDQLLATKDKEIANLTIQTMKKSLGI
ncbi:hypothetical protein FE257_002952 [Aspergillus nanangensis]|uniref:Uncharacterized protein n=1 Tax=Aspergillus nanangensis TaxID=2582783 RepID=A0AAD4GXW4_ASPNN|nr:hypothetical protein FE257_002952 [Aspergillus nanangensis]